MNYNYLIEYKDNLSFLNFKNEIIRKTEFQEAELSEYYLDESNLNQALEAIDTYGFLNSKKIVIIKNIELLDIEKKETKHLLKYLENPDDSKLLFLLSKNLDSRKKITKELKSRAEFVKLLDDPLKIAQTELKEYKIEQKALNLLLEYSNNQVDIIKTECDKLKAYKDTDKNINIEDIKLVGYKHMTDTSNLVFDLVRYICTRNKRLAIITYHNLHDANTEDLGIMGLLESQLRLLEQVSLLLKERYRNKEIADILESHPYRIEKTVELLRNISINEINQLIKKLAQIDLKIKNGEYEDKKPLEMFILNL